MQSPIVFDGGFSSELIKTFPEINGNPLWSASMILQNHEAILQVHKSFLEAGADAVLSSTYQASVTGFQKYLGCSFPESESLIFKGGELVLQAVEEFWENWKKKDQEFDFRRKPLACASLGPYGACLGDGSEYSGHYVETVSKEELIIWHKQRLRVLSEHDLSYFIFETIPALSEAKAIIELIREYPNLQFALTFSCKDGVHLNHGEDLSNAIKLVNRSDQVVAVGVNCTSPLYIESLLHSIKGITMKRIFVKPNSGEVWKKRDWVKDAPVQKLLHYLPTWIQLGANWIGGCCRVTPSDISEMKITLRNMSLNPF